MMGRKRKGFWGHLPGRRIKKKRTRQKAPEKKVKFGNEEREKAQKLHLKLSNEEKKPENLQQERIPSDPLGKATLSGERFPLSEKKKEG